MWWLFWTAILRGALRGMRPPPPTADNPRPWGSEYALAVIEQDVREAAWGFPATETRRD